MFSVKDYNFWQGRGTVIGSKVNFYVKEYSNHDYLLHFILSLPHPWSNNWEKQFLRIVCTGGMAKYWGIRLKDKMRLVVHGSLCLGEKYRPIIWARNIDRVEMPDPLDLSDEETNERDEELETPKRFVAYTYSKKT